MPEQEHNFDAALGALFGEDQKTQDKARQMSEEKHRELLTAVKDLVGSAAGKRLLWWLLGETHLFQTSFTGNSTTFFMEGERNIGLKLFALCMEAEPMFMQQLIDFTRGQEKKES